MVIPLHTVANPFTNNFFLELFSIKQEPTVIIKADALRATHDILDHPASSTIWNWGRSNIFSSHTELAGRYPCREDEKTTRQNTCGKGNYKKH